MNKMSVVIAQEQSVLAEPQAALIRPTRNSVIEDIFDEQPVPSPPPFPFFPTY